ncbi:hypothetical protein [Vibrio sp. 1978]|uniref:Acb2/Tad1 domain-containing protein n=1 Tax=Vibrio sp. 1978 TaxID=3074585 RepID=UPI0029660991|nr:hypothetical protein [Vibrio sp. 1978]MDW3058692.1 hypothetical protein [Vibrio sp. 1978]
MDNQHKKIKGYRDLTQDEIDLMNEIKEQGQQLESLVSKLEASNAMTGNHAIDMRWAQIGKTHLQQGIMALVRSVARPESF